MILDVPMPGSCNFNQDATVDDGSCGVIDDCGFCHVPCCYNEIAQECDYSINEQNCNNFWADYDVISDPTQNIFGTIVVYRAVLIQMRVIIIL